MKYNSELNLNLCLYPLTFFALKNIPACQKNTDGSGGAGDGSTQGSCQNGLEKCCSDGGCRSDCGKYQNC